MLSLLSLPLLALAPLASAQVTATGPNGPTNPSAPGFIPVGQTVNQNSDSRLISVNAIDDWCMYAPEKPQGTIGENEPTVVAWCTKPRNNARLIPDGTIHAAQLIRTPTYIQIAGWWDGTRINIQPGDNGGELDPHGADMKGNPVGGNVTTNLATGTDVFYEEWMMFVSYDQFCLRICTSDENGVPTRIQCNHIYDLMGCQWVMAIDDYWGMSKFVECEGDIAAPPGYYPQNGWTSTWYQGQNPTPAQPAFLPKKSSCTTFSTIANNVNTNDWKVTASPTYVACPPKK